MIQELNKSKAIKATAKKLIIAEIVNYAIKQSIILGKRLLKWWREKKRENGKTT